jgi:nucleotide-binding universal stress UspA family protein
LGAIDWAADEAALHSLPLRLVHACLWERYEGSAFTESTEVASERMLAQAIIERATERARQDHPEVRISVDIVPEDAEATLLREARRATVVVTGCRGRGPITGTLLGSVSRSLATRAPCTVVVVRCPRKNRQPANGPIVVGVDDPASGAAAIRFAFHEAQARHSVLEAIHTWRRPVHRAQARPLFAGNLAHEHEDQAAAMLDRALRDAEREHPDMAVRRVIAEGSAHHVLLAHSATADLLVLGAPRRRGPLGLPLGSVAHAVLRHAVCPVAVVPQH